MKILVTGASGFIGSALIDTLMQTPDHVVAGLVRRSLPHTVDSNWERIIGDVTDINSFKYALCGIDVIIHAAAIKQVDTAEYNPTECIRTNINGAENVIHAALDTGVKDVVALSTDKACAPINLYGATKLVSDKLFTAANNIRGSKNVRFSVVRYGNVMGSRGSVIPFFLDRKSSAILPITHPEMTRFNISLKAGVDIVMYALEHHLGGEIFIPKLSSYRILDIAEAIGPDCKTPIVGIRPGEKLHEEMITDTDSINTIDLGKYYVILPAVSLNCSEVKYQAHHKAKKVPVGFRYNSGTNEKWETVASLRDLIKKHVDPNFKVRAKK